MLAKKLFLRPYVKWLRFWRDAPSRMVLLNGLILPPLGWAALTTENHLTSFLCGFSMGVSLFNISIVFVTHSQIRRNRKAMREAYSKWERRTRQRTREMASEFEAAVNELRSRLPPGVQLRFGPPPFGDDDDKGGSKLN